MAEAIVAMAILGIMVIALYAGITSSFFTLRLAREDARATQIMLEKMEVIRLCTWEQINSNNFIPTSFTTFYYPAATNGLAYTGTVTITNTPFSLEYTGDMKLITVQISWVTQGLARNRKISTYFSRYGVQNYLLK